MRSFLTQRLPSGLDVIVAPGPHLSRAHVALYVRVGSRYETRATHGLSHFLEHMLYRGTPRLPRAHDVNLAFESLGGYLHAATYVDHGVFSVTVPSECIGEATALFGDVITRPTFADIEVEKRIVEEEILEDLDEDGREVDPDNLSRAQIYPGHPLGWTITGDVASVRSFDEAALRAHHARHYNVANMVLVFSGAIQEGTALDAAARAFGDVASGEPALATAPDDTQRGPRFSFVENAGSQTDLRVAFRAPSLASDRRAAMDMLMRVVDDGMATRLYHRLCDDQGLSYDVSAAYDGYADSGVLDFAVGCVHERAGQITREILAMMVELGAEGPTPAELEKARRRSLWDMRALTDAPEDLAAFLGLGWLQGDVETPDARVARNVAVASSEIASVAALVARPDRLNVLAVGLLDRADEDRLRSLVRAFGGA